MLDEYRLAYTNIMGRPPEFVHLTRKEMKLLEKDVYVLGSDKPRIDKGSVVLGMEIIEIEHNEPTVDY